MIRHLLAIVTLVGCAAGGDPGGGASALPNPGYAPYETYVPADAGPSQVIESMAANAPMAQVVHDQVHLLFGQCPDEAPCQIHQATSPDGVFFSAPVPILEDPRGVTAPYLETGSDGTDLWVVLDSGASLATASYRGDGVGSLQVVLQDGPYDAPSVVHGPAGRLLFFVRDSRLFRVEYVDGEWGAPESVMGPCTDDPCWPGNGVADVEVRRAVSATGRVHYRAAILEAGATSDAIGFALSTDGRQWSQVEFNPTVELGRGTYTGLSNLRFGARYLLYFAKGSPLAKIGVAINAAGQLSVDF